MAFLLATLLVAPVAAEPFKTSFTYIDPATGLKDADLKAILDKAIEKVELAYLPFFPEQADSPALDLMVMVNQGSPRSVSVILKDSTGTQETVFLQWTDPAELELTLAPMLFSMWARLNGLALTPSGETPKPSLEVSLLNAREAVGNTYPHLQSIGAIAPAPDAGVYWGSLGYLAEFNAELAPRSIYVNDSVNPGMSFFQVASNSMGTLLGVESTGVPYLLKRGSDKFERLPSSIPSTAVTRLDSTGIVYFYDALAQQLYRLQEGKKSTVTLSGVKPIGGGSVFDVDENGYLWIFDMSSSLIRCYSPDGVLSHAIRILPLQPHWMPWKMNIRGNEIILSDGKGLAAFDRFGLPLWEIPAITTISDGSDVSMLGSVCVASDGAIMVLDGGTQTLTRFDDARSLAAVRATRGEAAARLLERMIELNDAVARDFSALAPQTTRAEFADASLSQPVSLTLRAAMAVAFPADSTNQKKLASVRSVLARKGALQKADVVYAKLSRFGAETARADYQSAMAAFERYLAENPGDAEMATARIKLGDAFRAKESGTAPFSSPSLRLEAAFKPLFPAFAERYRTVPAGSVRITNTGGAPVSDITLTAEMKTFMDFPAEVRIPGPLAPGATVELPVFILFNRSVLDLREDTGVQLALNASSGSAYGSATVPVTVRSRSALTWDDTAALAAFITPNDDTIVSFTHAALALSPPPLFGRAHSKAFAIVNALAARGFTYVEDPSTPFTTAGSGGVVDTVRFPRATLASGAGDCDDTTALLASCLEAAGVSCAILTTPGHVFLAFQSDSPPGGPGKYEGAEAAAASYGYIQKDGAWWIPLESTVLSKGFAEVWRTGYALAAKAGTALEVVPLAQARVAYPSMPLPGTPALPPVPAQDAYLAAATGSIKVFRTAFVVPIEAAVGKAAKGKDKANAYNDYGVRLAQLGDYAAAVDAFKKAAAEDKSLAAPRVNLVGALKLAGDAEGAALALAAALKDLPGSPAVKRLAEREGQTVITAAPAAGASPSLAGAGSAGPRGADAAAGFEFDWGD